MFCWRGVKVSFSLYPNEVDCGHSFIFFAIGQLSVDGSDMAGAILHETLKSYDANLKEDVVDKLFDCFQSHKMLVSHQQGLQIVSHIMELYSPKLISKLDTLIDMTEKPTAAQSTPTAVHEAMVIKYGARTSLKVVAQLLKNYYLENNCTKYEQLLDQFTSTTNFTLSRENYAQLIELQINAKQPTKALEWYAKARQQYAMPSFCLYSDLPIKLTEQLIEQDLVTEAMEFLQQNRFAVRAEYASEYPQRVLFKLLKQYRNNDEPEKASALWQKLSDFNAIPNREFTKQSQNYLKKKNIDLPRPVNATAKKT